MNPVIDGALARTRLPEGARDLLPVQRQDLEAIERAMRDSFGRFGYREVRTPMLEYADVMDRALEGGVGRAFRLFDEHGQVLVLRPDLTIPVARMVAGRFSDHVGALRLSYVAPVARPARPGRAQGIEERQAGVELIGVGEASGDAEVIALLVSSLRAQGIDDVQVSVGDVGLIRAAIAGLGVDDATLHRLEEAARARDLIPWREVSDDSGIPADARATLAALPTLRGGRDLPDEVAREIPATADECRRLGEMIDLLESHGVADSVVIDLGVLRDWGYYTGVVFEGFAPGISTPVALGGRYDALLGRFGADRPAVGFGVLLDPLHEARRRRTTEIEPTGVVLVGGRDGRVALANAIREAGHDVVAAGAGEAGEDIARAERRRFVVDGRTVVDRVLGTRTTVSDDQEVLAFLRS